MSYSYPAYLEEQAKNWGCPDWHDKDAYPDSGESLRDGHGILI
jgi:hypothetical protein